MANNNNQGNNNASKKSQEAVTPKSEDISRWYTDVVLKAKMADYSPVRGCTLSRPMPVRS